MTGIYMLRPVRLFGWGVFVGPKTCNFDLTIAVNKEEGRVKPRAVKCWGFFSPQKIDLSGK
jgi:hypothetical protein